MISKVRRLVVAAAALAAAATVVVPAPTATAATPTHVGIVVRFGDGNLATACTTVGGDGYNVLSRKFRITIGTSGPYAGFLLQINQLPDPAKPDTTHYWSYWHGTSAGSWTYSSTGAGSYTPKAGTIEGWSYVNGESSAPKPATSGTYTYAGLCGSLDTSPKPTATPKSSTVSVAKPTKAASHTAQSSRTSTGLTHSATATTAPVAPTTASALATSAAKSLHSLTRSPGPTLSPATPSSSSRQTFGASPLSFTPTPTTAATKHAASGFPAWGTLVALVVVLALGAGAWLVSKRRTE